IIDLVGENFADGARHVRLAQPPRVEQQGLGGSQAGNGGIDGFHIYRCNQRTRWRSAGKAARTSDNRTGSMVPLTSPGPSGSTSSTSPQGSTSMLWPQVRLPLG